MKIDLKLTLYRLKRNYVLLRLIRFVVNDYVKWEEAQESKKLPYKELPLPGHLVPFSSAVNAISALHLRGGSSKLPIIIALYKIFYIIKKYIIMLVPKAFIKYFADYKALRDKYPKLKYLEDLLTLLLSVATVSIAVKTKTPDFVLSYKVQGENSHLDFANVAEELGVNTEIFNFKNSIIFEALMSRDLSDSDKVNAFRIWLLEFRVANNSGEKQGLLLCKIALLIYFYISNFCLFLDILRYLISAVNEGVISKSIFKVIIRRLMKQGVKVPASYVDY